VTKFRRMIRAATVIVMALASAAATRAEEMSGLWKGPWYLGMSSGVAVLRLDDGVATFQMTNNESFGSKPISLKDIVADGKQLRFRAVGEDGTVMVAILPVREDGAIRGPVKFGAYKLVLELYRSRTDGDR